jgi:integrase
MSYGRIENYSGSVIRILKIKDDKKIEHWSKREIELVHKVIANSAYENSVKKDTLTALKRLYHFAIHDEIAIKAKGIEYDPVVSWITPSSFVDRFEKIQAKDLLTDDEILQLIQAIKQIGGRFVKRNIALIFILLEGAYRPGELLNIRISGIEFESDFVRIYTTGKTGPKSLTLVASYGPLKEWLSIHPQSDDPDAFLFYQDNNNNVMRYWTLDYKLTSKNVYGHTCLDIHL